MTIFNTYKPSNKGSIVGIIALFAVLTLVGSAMAWLYLTLNSFIPLIYLRIFFAVGFGFALGGVGSVVVGKFKLRAPVTVLVISIVSLLLVTYVKWAIYVAKDYDKYFYDEIKDLSAKELIGETGTVTEEQAEQFLKLTALYKSVTFDRDASSGTNQLVTSIYLQLLKPLGDNFGEILETIYGSTVEEIMANFELLNKKPNLTLYSYLYEERGLQKRTTMWMITHPGNLMTDIKDINEQGRWTIKSHRYGGIKDTSEDTNISGIMLWLVWLGELIIICAPAVVLPYNRATEPYIEGEDDWAVRDKNAPNFMFEDPYPGQAASQGIVKSEIMKNPDYIFSMTPIPIIARIPDKYYKVEFYHSKYYDEIYVTVISSCMTNPRKNQRNNSEIIKYMRVDADYLATLYGLFEQPVPVMCHGENRAKDVQKQNAEKEQAIANGKPLSPTPPKATGAEAIFDQPSAFSPYKQVNTPTVAPTPTVTDEPSFAQQELMNEQKSAPKNHGDMDGLDTSNLDLDNFDFSKMK